MSLDVQVLIAGHGANLKAGSVQAALQEVAPLVNDSDLLIASLSLSFCTVLLQKQPQQSGLVTDKVLPAAMSLAKSPLLQVCASTLVELCVCLFNPLPLHALTWLGLASRRKMVNEQQQLDRISSSSKSNSTKFDRLL